MPDSIPANRRLSVHGLTSSSSPAKKRSKALARFILRKSLLLRNQKKLSTADCYNVLVTGSSDDSFQAMAGLELEDDCALKPLHKIPRITSDSQLQRSDSKESPLSSSAKLVARHSFSSCSFARHVSWGDVEVVEVEVCSTLHHEPTHDLEDLLQCGNCKEWISRLSRRHGKRIRRVADNHWLCSDCMTNVLMHDSRNLNVSNQSPEDSKKTSQPSLEGTANEEVEPQSLMSRLQRYRFLYRRHYHLQHTKEAHTEHEQHQWKSWRQKMDGWRSKVHSSSAIAVVKEGLALDSPGCFPFASVMNKFVHVLEQFLPRSDTR